MNNKKYLKNYQIVKKILEDKGYKVIYIGLYGSQNYNLDDEKSDIDVKAIILPNLHDIIFRKVTSKTIECENGNIDVKDLITFYDVIKKGNFSYIESIDTKYSIGDKYIKELFQQFRPNLKSILGAILDYNDPYYSYEYININNEISKYIEDKIKLELGNTNTTSAREYRTFDNPIPKKDLEKFPVLEQYKGQDISYIVYESIDIL